ncbi:fumarylacetoacetate hydrolase family protein [Hoeflea alexandrii]|uniref:fumarylacetoacetate hydrolase family protein n=1 Tax=Hoeflea alexandrii TaxID=288436 RepID=UPI0022AE9A1E|nr:fumarylacetoacetate hydrolase family protein [Hoeflea alexandrii]MCZ4290784.1 fumarylacetoacetate hydrolase family protein [Hoeflea alexandrii]
MKFVTLANGTPDGRLHVASRDGQLAVPADNAGTLQQALETWAENAILWQAQYDRLNAGEAADAQPLSADATLAPLPRAWQWLDGSAFETHSLLIQKAWGQPEVGLNDRPLMYQGMSDRFLPPTATAVFPSARDGIDFEGEYGVILDAVPMGTRAEDASRYIRLIVLINDWSLRTIGPIEMATGFGWLQCKPACGIAPFAVTPDELGASWQNNRVCLPLQVRLNGAEFGRTNGNEMKFGFDQLIAHAAYSRNLPAGTILGSGTVSNKDYESVGSSCIAERRAIETIRVGEARTRFMQNGDRVQMRSETETGDNLFGDIAQTVSVLGP